MIAVIIAGLSLVVSVLSLVLWALSEIYQRKKDNKLLKPQLFLKTLKMQTVDYAMINMEMKHHDKIFKEYIVPMTFINVTDVKVLDLSVSIDVKKNNTFNFLLDNSLKNSQGHMCSEKDWNGNNFYSWEGIFSLHDNEKKKIDILNERESFEISVPSIFTALLEGAMYSYREGLKKSDSEIEFEIELSYKHVFSDDYVKIKKTFSVKITYKDAIQGPYIVYDSIIFEQL